MSSTSSPIYLAIDLGASSGRVLSVACNERSLDLEVLHRFANTPVTINNSLYWNHLTLGLEIQNGLRTAGQRFGDAIGSIGVDTWGVDYLLLDKRGMPIGPGYCYRDDRNVGMMERAFKRLPKAEIFRETGIQFMQINTLYQLLEQRLHQPQLLDAADVFLMIPDYYHWLLTGEKVNEVTNASTSQILQPTSQQWSAKICDAMGFNSELFLPPTQPGTTIGRLQPSIRSATSLGDVDVVCPATHDTASAVLAVPVDDFANSQPKWGYISSGTWSLMGVELDRPVLSDECLELNFTNEAGPHGSIRLLKNIAGLWPIQQVREDLLRRGGTATFEAMMLQATDAPPLRRLVNLDDPRLINPSNMTEAIHEMLQSTGQSVPAQTGEMSRLLLESLTMRYRVCLGRLERLLGYSLEVLYVIGGGVQNKLLCQFTADATNRTVMAGHPESTAVGNAMMQAIGTGRFASIRDARKWLGEVTTPTVYRPQTPEHWDEAWLHYETVICPDSADNR